MQYMIIYGNKLNYRTTLGRDCKGCSAKADPNTYIYF